MLPGGAERIKKSAVKAAETVNIEKTIDKSNQVGYTNNGGHPHGCFPLTIKITAMFEQGGYLFLFFSAHAI